ncbi:hypothetical protein [Flavobacterium yafengii]|uniref:hypothetical protein n=1 Tax=Flavobacterium yafengii TaxID=3041253 RepID=UPI0024A86DB3|nr:hypothetical protein [Flavobacterium yafengii]MDI6046464.1 hypothetical protein [Flavobacterium yafengii]
MKIKLKSNIPFKIEKNPYNKVFFPRGLFWNIPKIKHNNIWYNCAINFKENNLIISNLILHHENSSLVKEHLSGEFLKEKTSDFKRNLILFLYNEHPINHKIYYLKKGILYRRKSFFIFGLAVILSIAYYLINQYLENSFMNWIANNLVAQTFIMFLTLSGFINIFTPFTIQKEITENDVAKIALKAIEKKKKEDELNDIIIKRASF